MDEKNCGNCAHYFSNAAGASECRRLPPTALLVPRQDPLQRTTTLVPAGVFPPTAPVIYCGEHAPAAPALVTP